MRAQVVRGQYTEGWVGDKEVIGYRQEEEVAPEFYKTSADGIPRDWVARIRRSLRTLGPEFGAGRMLEDYERKVYT